LKRIVTFVLFNLVYAILWLYCRTWRFEVSGKGKEMLQNCFADKKPLMVALWHNSLLPLLFHWRHNGAVIVVSQSKDGELITKVLHRLGFYTVRGSSSRGGTRAILGMSKYMGKGHVGAITVDGPKGPRHQAKPGIIHVAKLAKCPLLTATINCKRAKVFASWDKFILPMPFSKIYVRFSEPIILDGGTDEDSIERDRAALEKIMTKETNEHSPDYI
jgi:hypothetical protein